jgi:uridine kinase
MLTKKEKEKAKKELLFKREVEKAKSKLLLQKIREDYGCRGRTLNPFIKDYYNYLHKKFDRFIFVHIQRAQNGFRNLTLVEQLKELSAIKSEIENIAELNNPDNPHIGIAMELTEEVFYRIRDVYSPMLNYDNDYSTS